MLQFCVKFKLFHADSPEKYLISNTPKVKGGYFPVPPVDQLHEVRADICAMAEAIGLKIEAHHHEVANSGQCELRFPDPTANPYLAFAASLMAGLDGIINKIDPGEPSEKDLYDLPPEEEATYQTVCASLEEALAALDADRDFLKAGGVFTDEAIDSYIKLKMEEVTRMRATTHPIEFDMYYSA